MHSPRLDPLVGPPAARILGAGGYRVLVTTAGTGFSSFGNHALTVSRGDDVEDSDGFFLYLRDRENGEVWSASWQPEGTAPDEYEATWHSGVMTLACARHDIEARTEICVCADRPGEIRRITLLNRDRRTRVIELTTFAEVALLPLRAHAAHPAFSKLFLQTEFSAPHQALLVHRRPRGAGEHHPWLVHATLGAPVDEFETDRAAFLGRGRHPRRPLALVSSRPLGGTTGAVLDPIVSLRRVVRIGPGESATAVFLLGVGEDRTKALELARTLATEEDVEAAFRGAGVGEEATSAPAVSTTIHVADREPRRAPRESSEAVSAALQLANGHGGFDDATGAYVIPLPHLEDGVIRLPPRPWVNVIANERFGFLVSETGAACTWSENSREHPLTPWANDPLLDPHGEAFYLRDEDDGAFWSPLAGPAPGGADYEMRHGHGYSECLHTCRELETRWTAFVPSEDALKITRIHVANRSGRTRCVSVFAYCRLALGATAEEARDSIVTRSSDDGRVLFGRNPRAEAFADRVAYLAAAAPGCATGIHAAADRSAFIGHYRSPANPAALAPGVTLDGCAGSGLDPCFALQVILKLAPAEACDVVFLLGEEESEARAEQVIARYRSPTAPEAALRHVRQSWQDLAAIRIQTPSPALDRMVNAWLPYQTASCRLWGRSALYQASGAYGFRDQLQDAGALVLLRPDLTRRQILLHAAHQFVEGDVLHWWHPPADAGIRTRCSDDLLWLPYLAAQYASTTGDEAILDEVVPFLSGPAVPPDEDEIFMVPVASAGNASLYEHCCRALDRSLATGRNGLPLFGSGDWNDGLNRVGRAGRGESVWLGFFLYAVLGEFLPFVERRGEVERARRYAGHREDLRAALERAAWDGEWYLRGWYDDGAPLGSQASDECRIDALVQAWAVLSGAAAPERASRAMDAVEEHLVSETDGIIRLLAPPFDHTPHDPGYIKGYVPGIRENGGQYTHAALWVVQAMAALGRRDRAAVLLEMLTPIHHTCDAAAVARYQVEPYVVAADVYGAPPHVGRGGWTWYTGSAGWMYRTTVEWLLGMRMIGGRALRIAPCVPDAWPGFCVTYRVPGCGSRYEIEARNPSGHAREVIAVTIDGKPACPDEGAAIIPLARDGGEHRVEIVLG